MVNDKQKQNNLTRKEQSTTTAFKMMSTKINSLEASLKKTQNESEKERKEKHELDKKLVLLEAQLKNNIIIEIIKFSKEYNSETYNREPIINLYRKYNNLVVKELCRKSFIYKKDNEERNNFGIKTYTLIEDPVYNKICTEISQVSDYLAKRLNITFY